MHAQYTVMVENRFIENRYLNKNYNILNKTKINVAYLIILV